MNARLAVLAASAVLLAACATQPKPLQGEFASITPRDAAANDSTGAAVRWGGRIVQVEPQSNRTCFEMISTNLGTTGRPSWGSDDTGGRFLACRTGFYDPAVFEKNREVTFVGRVSGYETRKIGGYDYRFPVVDADVVYLWPQRETVDVIYNNYPPHPWPWWGWGWW
ncbi:Slp family lipoprotein [Vulcaniibacterium tengchongense]|uniref:Outer membrane lipoprotein n=1 Tax=Vulcaniibacterium tengchongense TaxID=1273429 RepID=A0A3N4W585_9GAMM|nr:Slp family lipoprotein [Vulcaniibacterium tengchongense]RPE81250.1 outer membrane lipoprotein [Vulcaniibacterium tengchongense]